jgi:uncharacterized protein (DUF1810 family)
MPEDSDPFRLSRFLDAQNPVYAGVCSELQRGRKESHWMWFIFPQLAGLGYSGTARFYAIKSVDEAKAFLQHQVLGKRLAECAELVLKHPEKSASRIFGFPDDLKLRSCMTLFASVSDPESVFHRVLDQFFGGEPDAKTLELLRRG